MYLTRLLWKGSPTKAFMTALKNTSKEQYHLFLEVLKEVDEIYREIE